MSLQTKVIGRQPTDHGPYDPNLAYGKKFQCTLFGCAWESLHDNNNTAPAVWDGGDTITPNLVDWKKVSGSYEAWLMNHDKPAASEQYPFNGMGRVRLQKNLVEVEEGGETVTKNLLTQAMFEDGDGNPLTNTVFEVPYEFELAEDITIPENCVLDFKGGGISSGSGANKDTITGQGTKIIAGINSIFNGILIAGTWLVSDIYSNWFENAEQDNVLKQVFKLASDDIHNNVYIGEGTFNLSVATDTRETVIDVNKKDTDVFCNGTLELATNAFVGYNIVAISADNVKWHGGAIKGDAKTHDYTTTTSTHEWGYGIALTGSNCVIEGVNISLCTGDGICVKEECANNEIKNINISKCRRQGMTIADVTNLVVENFDIRNIGDFTVDGVSVTGTLPKAAFDIEPDSNTPASIDIIIQNGVIDSCDKGFTSYRDAAVAQNTNILVRNIECTNCTSQCAIMYSTKSVMFYNIVTDKHIYFNEVTNAIFSNVKCPDANLGFLGGKLKVINSQFNDNEINGGFAIFINSELKSLRSSTSDEKSIILDNCYVGTDNGTPINFSSTGPFKMYARNCKFEKDTLTGSVGVAFIGGNMDLTFEKCGIYCKNGQRSFVQQGDVTQTKVTLINCKNYKWDGNAYVEDMSQVSNFDKVYAVFTEQEFVVGSTRPTLSTFSKGHRFFDESLSPAKPIYWTGSAWVDATGASV